MRAIETMYAGTLFRSRLEARWAVFFDALEISWQFEPEGFIVGVSSGDPMEDEVDFGRRYLPDFYLPTTETWVEVKGSEDHLDRDLLCRAVDYGRGLPGTDDSYGTKRGVLVLGPIPRPGVLYGHSIIQHHKGAWLNQAFFNEGGFLTNKGGGWFGDGYAGCDWTQPVLTPLTIEELNNQAASAAYSAARSARFEHGHREVWSR